MSHLNRNATAKTRRREERREGIQRGVVSAFPGMLASWRVHLVLSLAVMMCAGRLLADDSSDVPFYYAVGTGVEPQISTLVVGVNENAGQAVRSAEDRKYVSLNMDTSLLNSAGVRRFQYQKGGLGFVGSAAPSQIVAGQERNGMTPSIAASPDEIDPAVSVLDKLGMVLLKPLER